jgi:hypothetical protein
MALGRMVAFDVPGSWCHDFFSQVLSCNGLFRYSPAMGHFLVLLMVSPALKAAHDPMAQ